MYSLDETDLSYRWRKHRNEGGSGINNFISSPNERCAGERGHHQFRMIRSLNGFSINDDDSRSDNGTSSVYNWYILFASKYILDVEIYVCQTRHWAVVSNAHRRGWGGGWQGEGEGEKGDIRRMGNRGGWWEGVRGMDGRMRAERVWGREGGGRGVEERRKW